MSLETDFHTLVQQLDALVAVPLTEESLVRMEDWKVRFTVTLAVAGESLRLHRPLPPEDATGYTEEPTLDEIREAIHQQSRVWRAMEGIQTLATLDQRRGN